MFFYLNIIQYNQNWHFFVYFRMESKYQLKLYEGADTGKDFLKAIHRRNDTFYVLSFDEVRILIKFKAVAPYKFSTS